MLDLSQRQLAKQISRPVLPHPKSDDDSGVEEVYVDRVLFD
jgi:hypothetical protein